MYSGADYYLTVVYSHDDRRVLMDQLSSVIGCVYCCDRVRYDVVDGQQHRTCNFLSFELLTGNERT